MAIVTFSKYAKDTFNSIAGKKMNTSYKTKQKML